MDCATAKAMKTQGTVPDAIEAEEDDAVLEKCSFLVTSEIIEKVVLVPSLILSALSFRL